MQMDAYLCSNEMVKQSINIHLVILIDKTHIIFWLRFQKLISHIYQKKEKKYKYISTVSISF